MNQTYSNEKYWLNIHSELDGSLRAVGWPSLSEGFNQIKYASERASLLQVLDSLALDGSPDILEVGVGIGFWLSIIEDFYARQGSSPTLTAADISPEALSGVLKRNPDITTQQLDLQSVPENLLSEQFDLVLALMVLLHLTEPAAFENGLKFSAASVRPGGFLVLYEPAIVQDYSPWLERSIAADDNSLSRSLSDFDEILFTAGFQRKEIVPGASWLTNSPIEASSRIRFQLQQLVWKVLSKTVYGSDGLSMRSRSTLLKLDKKIKQSGLGQSGKFIIYQKTS